MKWVHDNRWGLPDTDRVTITKNGESYDQFPDHNGLNDFDNSDRKFIAVANTHPAKPPVLQATDSKWWGWKDALKDDKVMSELEREMFLRHELVVEEKVDGANLGISFDGEAHARCQNRGAYLQYPYTGQWKKLSEWLDAKTDILFEKLTDRYILFGEWCYAQHSIFYDQLPDWFLGFDIFDKESLKFLSYPRRDAVF
jgi:hypothetical protein